MGMTFIRGLPETRCGAGSTLENTQDLRPKISELFKDLRINILLDAPCGDFNWMAHTDLSGLVYIGCDTDLENLRTAKEKVSGLPPRSRRFLELDVISGDLPAADLMLCRDFFQHITNSEAKSTLENFMRSGIEWLLATSHENSKNVDLDRHGFRPLNLVSAPFYLPAPERFIPDGPNRILGLWNRRNI